MGYIDFMAKMKHFSPLNSSFSQKQNWSKRMAKAIKWFIYMYVRWAIWIQILTPLWVTSLSVLAFPFVLNLEHSSMVTSLCHFVYPVWCWYCGGTKKWIDFTLGWGWKILLLKQKHFLRKVTLLAMADVRTEINYSNTCSNASDKAWPSCIWVVSIRTWVSAARWIYLQGRQLC